MLATEGESMESFYVLLEGEMRVSRNYGNQAILMGVTKPGMFLGEISLLLDSPNLATVRTLKPCRLFRFGQGRVLADVERLPIGVEPDFSYDGDARAEPGRLFPATRETRVTRHDGRRSRA